MFTFSLPNPTQSTELQTQPNLTHDTYTSTQANPPTTQSDDILV